MTVRSHMESGHCALPISWSKAAGAQDRDDYIPHPAGNVAPVAVPLIGGGIFVERRGSLAVNTSATSRRADSLSGPAARLRPKLAKTITDSHANRSAIAR